MHIALLFRNVFHRHKNFFSYCIKTTPLHYFKKKHFRKTILFYIIVTVSRGTYLGIVQNTKRKFLSSVGNMWKNHMFDTDFMFFFFIFWPSSISLARKKNVDKRCPTCGFLNVFTRPTASQIV